MSARKRNKIKLLWVVSLLPLILLTLYLLVYVPAQPQYILDSAADDMLTATGTPYMQLQNRVNSAPSSTTPSLAYEGTQNITGAISLAVKIVSPSTATFTLQSTDGKKFFIKGTGLENIPKLFPNDASLTPLAHAKADQWYVIDHNPIASFMRNPLNFWQLHFEGDDAKKYKDAYHSNEFFIVDQILSSEKIANQQAEHYKVSINSKKFDSFVRAFAVSKPTAPCHFNYSAEYSPYRESLRGVGGGK